MLEMFNTFKLYIYGIGAAIIASYVGYLKYKSASLEDDIEDLNKKIDYTNTKAILKAKDLNIDVKTITLNETTKIKKQINKKRNQVQQTTEKLKKEIDKASVSLDKQERGSRVKAVFTI